MFNVYKNQLSRQTGSRNLTGPKTLPRIWYTDMTLVTKYEISTINSYWEKCDEKYLGRTEGQTHIEHICSFFSATIDGRNLIFDHKLHIGTPYRGKRFWTHQIPTSCLPTLLILMGSKTLPTIWGTYMKLATKYQISAINSCWEKCDEKWA
jgi:hypothetical protein